MTGNDVHHIIPRHVAPSLVLNPSNLITLCRKYGCHLRCGHFGNYRKYWNPDIRKIFPGVGSVMAEAEKEFKKTMPKPETMAERVARWIVTD